MSPRPSDARRPVSISAVKPVATPLVANITEDLKANQIEISVAAAGAAVTLGTTTLWYYDPGRTQWRDFVLNWKNGQVIADGYGTAGKFRRPIFAAAYHIQSVGIVNVASAVAEVITIRGGS